MATAQQIQDETSLVASKFTPWLLCHRNSADVADMLYRTTNVDVMYTNEKGEMVTSNLDINQHARADDIEACIQKGLKLLFGKDEVALVTQTLRSGIPTIRMLYDDRRRGLTGGMNWMMTSNYVPFLTEDEKKTYTKKYTLLINIRERTNQHCGNPACEEQSKHFKKCSQCEEAVYCCEDCQRTHWKAHKPTCLASPWATKKATIHNA